MAEYEDFSDDSDTEDLGLALKEDGLSHVGKALVEGLGKGYKIYQGIAWNLSWGKLSGPLLQTPPGKFYEDLMGEDDATTHSDFLPDKMAELITTAEEYVDYTTLSVPDGLFLDTLAKALNTLSEAGKQVTVRIMCGNIPGIVCDHDQLIQDLANHKEFPLKKDTSVKLYVGAWRKGISWNHSKIIAVDGKRLFTGGHNPWDPHYLKRNPVRDLSLLAEGAVAIDGHHFANYMWKYIIRKDKERIQTPKFKDWVPSLKRSHVGIGRWPPTAPVHPPMFETRDTTPLEQAVADGYHPIISMGRFGNLHHNADTENPADKGIVAMLRSATKSIKLSQQDIGPIAIPLPTGPIALPGGAWPEEYLRELGVAIYERGVDVEVVLSRPNSIPSNLSMIDANYGNGWSCEDVAAEIIKAAQKAIPDFDSERLAGLVGLNLKVCFCRSSGGPDDWSETEFGKKSGNHAKFFIVDDQAAYIGSQNMYVCNLAEWGIVLDSKEAVEQILEEYWNKLWAASYENVPEGDRDVNVDKVLDGLELDRNPKALDEYSPEELEQILLRKRAMKQSGPKNSLTVWVKRAKGLADADFAPGGGSSDSYVKLRLLNKKGKRVGPAMKTRVIDDGGANPSWNEVIVFEGLEDPASLTLKLVVYDSDSFMGLGGSTADWLDPDDLLGSATFSLAKLKKTAEYDHRDLTIAKGWFENSYLLVAFNTGGHWGQEPK